jgi:hypothetical protein
MDATTSAILVQTGKFIVSSFPTWGVGGIIGSVITILIKNRLELNSENKRRIRDEKEKQYKAFLNNLLGFFEKWKDDALQLQFMWEVYANAAVYASDEVLRLAYSYIKSFDKTKPVNDDERQQIYANLVITIRNELNKITGGSKSKLKAEEIKIYGFDNVDEKVKKQFFDNMHPKINL